MVSRLAMGHPDCQQGANTCPFLLHVLSFPLFVFCSTLLKTYASFGTRGSLRRVRIIDSSARQSQNTRRCRSWADPLSGFQYDFFFDCCGTGRFWRVLKLPCQSSHACRQDHRGDSRCKKAAHYRSAFHACEPLTSSRCWNRLHSRRAFESCLLKDLTLTAYR